MIAFIAHNIAPIMFASLVLVLLVGYPVSFSLAAVGIGFFALGVELAPYSGGAIHLDWAQIAALPENVYGIMQRDTLLAIPFFTFMGLILERSGMAEDLLDTIGQLFGPVRGGLAYAVIFVGALLAATTGVVAASVISMGLISLPIMLRYGYDRRLATGVIAASGTLAQIIPPSLVLIVMADQLGRSVGDMYKGAFIPGLVLSALYAVYVFGVTMVYPNAAPALPKHARTLGSGAASLALVLLAAGLVYYGADRAFLAQYPGMALENAAIWSACAATLFAYAFATLDRRLKTGLLSRLASQVVIVLVPPLALIFLVLGTIFLGIATPTQGGAMGALGTILLALAKRRLPLALLKQAMDSTAKLSVFVVFILVGSRVFSLTFFLLGGKDWVEHLLTNLPGGQIGFLIFVNVFVFVLAFFLDFFELAFIVVPLIGPAAEKLGIDLIWFGVILGVNMQTSFMHPPFGFALFYLRSVAPKADYRDKITGKIMGAVTTAQIYLGAIPFVVIQVIMIALVIIFPAMVMVYKSGEVKLNQQQIDQQFKSIAPGGGDDGPAPFKM